VLMYEVDVLCLKAAAVKLHRVLFLPVDDFVTFTFFLCFSCVFRPSDGPGMALTLCCVYNLPAKRIESGRFIRLVCLSRYRCFGCTMFAITVACYIRRIYS